MFGLLDFVAHIYGERHSVSWIVDWEILRKEWPMIVLQVDVAKFADHWPLNFGLYLENFKSFSEVMCKKLAFFLLFLVPNIPPFAIKSRYNMFVFFSFIFMISILRLAWHTQRVWARKMFTWNPHGISQVNFWRVRLIVINFRPLKHYCISRNFPI